MRRVGTATGVVQHLIIARSDDDEKPRVGSTVIDDQLESIGTVVDVFGPVSQPYIAISPDETASVSRLIGTRLYAR